MPHPGDLIEIHRSMYCHWALYIGNGEVIHFAPTSEVAGAGASSLMSVMHNKAKVRRDPLKTVAGTDKYCVNNYLDDKYQPKDVEELLMKAKSLVGHTLDYNITQFNCEHFVNSLRYGKPHSQQVKDGIEAGVGVLGAMVLGAGLMYLVFGGGKEEENKNERRLRRY